MSNHEEHSFPPKEGLSLDARTIVELGCNVGEVTERLADVFLDANILAIEMNPVTADQARARLKSFYPRVVVLTQAVGYPSRLSGAVMRGTQQDHLTEGNDLEVLTLDHILTLEGLSGSPIDFIKMDIEGAEYEILIGGGQWAKRTSTMLIERHRDDPIDVLVRALGFNIRPHLQDPVWGNHHWCWKESA